MYIIKNEQTKMIRSLISDPIVKDNFINVTKNVYEQDRAKTQYESRISVLTSSVKIYSLFF